MQFQALAKELPYIFEKCSGGCCPMSTVPGEITRMSSERRISNSLKDALGTFKFHRVTLIIEIVIYVD